MGNELILMKDTLMNSVQEQLANLKDADYHELGAAIDMIKDLAEAVYYCQIVDAMKEKSEEDYYTTKSAPSSRRYYEDSYYRDMDKGSGRMYYTDGSMSSSGRGDTSYYTEYSRPMTMEWHDRREGRSPNMRRMYMESKEMHSTKETSMRDLENYLSELSNDITEMIGDASPEEK